MFPYKDMGTTRMNHGYSFKGFSSFVFAVLVIFFFSLSQNSSASLLSTWFPSVFGQPRVLVRREIPTLQDVMDDAMKRSEQTGLGSGRHKRGVNSQGEGGHRGDDDDNKLTKEELEESKRKSRVMTQLLDSIFNNYDMYIRPGFQESEPLIVESNMVLTSMGPFSDFEAQAQTGSGEGGDDGRRIAVDPEAGVQVSGSRSRDSSSYPVIPEFTFQCFFRHFWRDKRLAFEDRLNQTETLSPNETIKTLMLNSIMLNKVWKPDTFFRGNGQNSYIHDITRPNQLFRLNPKGEIGFSSRLTISARCPMDFSNFPMDEQECLVEFGSYGYDNSQIVYKWREKQDKAITIEADDIRLSQFEFKEYEYNTRNLSYSSVSGNYSMLSIKFKFRRNVGYFIMQTYLPCMMIVGLSWIAFYINREAAPARISLGITTVLTMTTFAISSRQQIPKVSYPSAMDWFVLACYFFVFVALVEYAVVNYFTKRSEAGKLPPPQNLEGPPAKKARLSDVSCSSNGGPVAGHVHDFPLDDDCSQPNADSPPFENMNSFFIRFIVCLCGSVQYKTYKLDHITTQFNSVSHIDEICRVGFPALFMVFNLIYWSVYFPRD